MIKVTMIVSISFIFYMNFIYVSIQNIFKNIYFKFIKITKVLYFLYNYSLSV